jgi:hypothetical protein
MFNKQKKRSKLEERFDKTQKGLMASYDKGYETKGEMRKERKLERKWSRLKGKMDKTQDQSGTESTPMMPGRTLTAAEVWKKPTLGGMKRDYLSEDRKSMRAAAAAGRAFRKGKMS